MLNVIGFILFIIYTSLIFFIKDYFMLAVVLFINIMLMIIFKISFKNTAIFLLKIFPFILFTAVINVLLSSLQYGIIIGIRLILVCNITYIFSRKMTPRRMQFAIERLLLPLRIFKVNTKDIGIMVSISIAFIPIVQKEFESLKYSLKSKGFELSFKNFIKNPNYILVPLITSIIRKTSEIEQSLISKGYVS